MKLLAQLAVALGFLSLLPTGKINAQEESPPDTNPMCPVLADEPIDPEISLEYEGKTVRFCCQKCRRKFAQSPERYLAALPQFGVIANDQDEQQASASLQKQPHEHDHAHDHGEATGITYLVSWAGKFHPIAVHFPIALILLAGVLELLGGIKRHDAWKTAARTNLFFGTLTAIVAAPLGWAAAANANYPELADTLFWHRWLGTTLTILAVAAYVANWAAGRSGQTKLEWTYRIMLGTLCLLIVITGHLGGTLVFGPDHLSW